MRPFVVVPGMNIAGSAALVYVPESFFVSSGIFAHLSSGAVGDTPAAS